MRRLLFLSATISLLPGCLSDDAPKPTIENKAVDVTVAKEAPVGLAARVDQIGRQIIGANPFLGVDPVFHTLGRAEPEVCHPDVHGLFVTSGLVERCKSDDEVAAVLASELAKMTAERRASDRMVRPEPLRQVAVGGNLNSGGDTSDLNQLGTQAVFDQTLTPPGRKKSAPAADNRKAAEDMMKAAGYDPKALAAVEPLLAEAGRNNVVARSFGGGSNRPQWSN
ncbi:MAG: hypothetical protein U0871_11740 [Gemmataceae bacterium]